MNHEALRRELRGYYGEVADARAETFRAACYEELDAAYRPDMSVYAMKRMQYGVITRRMDPILFHSSSFYFEPGTLAAHCDGARNFRGHRHAGGWVYDKNKPLFIDQDPELWDLVCRQKKEKLYLICGPYNDVSQHFCFHHRPVLQKGLRGVYEEAKAGLADASPVEADFLNSVCEGLLCLKTISEKFAAKAEQMLQSATDPAEKSRLSRIARAAARTPWEPPADFYEALNSYAFLRKVIGALEGIGFSSFGRLDMDLAPFYTRDLAAGKLTKAEAFDLILEFLTTFDCHYDHDMKFEGYADHELENTYVLGGCDADGKPFCNDLTLMFLRATREGKLIYPKIKLRYSADSPKEMLDEANVSLVNGTSVILYQNDDATIPAVLRMGRTIEEARDYLIFGCWGMDGNGYEKFDDGSYVNLIKPLEYSVHRDAERMKAVGIEFEPLDGAKNFEEVYDITFRNICALLKERNRITHAGGNIWDRVDVLPLFSSTLGDCIAKKKDYTAGGARYRDDRNELFAFVNVLDALLAIKELCFDRKKYTLSEYLDAVRDNWEGREEMRIDATRCHGWGDGSREASTLGRRLNDDIYAFVQTLTGAYGGKITLGHLAYTEVRWWGELTRATPDGRKSGDYLAQGLTPSRLHRIPYITSVVSNMAALDPSIFGGNTVVNLILPAGKTTLDTCEAFLRAAARSALMSMQLNCTSKEQLLDAQKHPERYPDLIVRVTGFSAKFTSLSPEWQTEFITRNFYDG